MHIADVNRDIFVWLIFYPNSWFCWLLVMRYMAMQSHTILVNILYSSFDFEQSLYAIHGHGSFLFFSFPFTNTKNNNIE